MLDIKFVREHLEDVDAAMKQRHAKFDAAEFARLDEVRRAAIAEEEELNVEGQLHDLRCPSCLARASCKW